MSADGRGRRRRAPPHGLPRLIAALKDATGAALLAFGLSVPILALRTEQNISNELILQPRWGYVAVAVALAFVARLLYLLAPALPASTRVTAPRGPADTRVHRPSAGSRCCCPIPCWRWRSRATGGAIKWIDNFGIQILIYIMLGWGLNIVVGLAGLLDLGYVAFYAVGAYAYALLATSDPIKASWPSGWGRASGRCGRSGSACRWPA